MSEGPPKKNHVWPPGPNGKRVHAHEVLGLGEADKHNVDKIKSAARRLSKRYHPDVQGGSEDHIKVVNQAAIEAVARAEGRWDERDGVARPKETVASLEAAETALKAQLAAERRRSTPDQARIQMHQSELRAVQGRKQLLKETEARAAAAEEQAYQERVEAGKREREAAEAAEERARQERVAAAEQNSARAESIDPASEIEPTGAKTSEQSGAADQTSEKDSAEAVDAQPEEEELVVTGTHVVPYVERDSEVVPQGEVIDHPIEPPGTDVVTVQESSEEEQAREPGTAVVVAETSLSGDIVPASAENPVQGGEVVPYEEDEYFPLAAAGGGGGEGGGDDDEDAAHDHPEGHGPHHAHGHDAHHGGHHGHGDHGHGSHDSGHGAGGHGSHGHAEEKKKGLFGAWWSFFGSLFAFGGETIKGFGTFFGKGGGGGGGGESHGHH